MDDLSDLPPAWGLREFDGKKWTTIREDEKTEAAQVSRQFLAAMLRRADDTMRGLMSEAMREARESHNAEVERARATISSEIERGVERRTASISKAAENVKAFEAAFGNSVAWDCNPQAWGRAARALSDLKGGFGPLAERLRKAADEIDALQHLALNGQDTHPSQGGAS